MKLHFCQREVSQVPFRWVDWSLQYRAGWSHPMGWFPLGAGRYLGLGYSVEHDERQVWGWGILNIVRPETDEERWDREEGWAEEAFMEREANRYTEWSY